MKVVLGGIDRVAIDIRSDRAAASIHVAHIYYLFRRKRHQIEAAARFGGGIAGDAAVPVTDITDADIRAAALFGRVAGDRAAVELAATGILAVEVAAVNAAARFGGYVVLNLAAVEMELCAGGGVDTAAVVGGPVLEITPPLIVTDPEVAWIPPPAEAELPVIVPPCIVKPELRPVTDTAPPSPETVLPVSVPP